MFGCFSLQTVIIQRDTIRSEGAFSMRRIIQFSHIQKTRKKLQQAFLRAPFGLRFDSEHRSIGQRCGLYWQGTNRQRFCFFAVLSWLLLLGTFSLRDMLKPTYKNYSDPIIVDTYGNRYLSEEIGGIKVLVSTYIRGSAYMRKWVYNLYH